MTQNLVGMSALLDELELSQAVPLPVIGVFVDYVYNDAQSGLLGIFNEQGQKISQETLLDIEEHNIGGHKNTRTQPNFFDVTELLPRFTEAAQDTPNIGDILCEAKLSFHEAVATIVPEYVVPETAKRLQEPVLIAA